MKQTLVRNHGVPAGLLLAVALASPAFAHAAGSAAIVVRDAWTRPANLGVNAAGYLLISNTGRTADRLTGASSPSAATVTLHLSQTVGGVASMRAVDGVPIRAGQTAILAPGGFHLMLEGLRRPFKVGDRVPLSLTFFKAGVVRTELTVRVAAPQAMPDMKM